MMPLEDISQTCDVLVDQKPAVLEINLNQRNQNAHIYLIRENRIYGIDYTIQEGRLCAREFVSGDPIERRNLNRYSWLATGTFNTSSLWGRVSAASLDEKMRTHARENGYSL